MKIWSALFSLLAAAAVSCAVWIVCTFQNTLPVLVDVPREATACVEEMMDAICRGDYAAAGENIYGASGLGADRAPADAVGKAVWEAFVESLDYELVGQCYATEEGIAQDIKIISLELPSATEKLGQRARELLVQGVAQAEDVSEIYDENNNYRDSFVQLVLREAARQALEEDLRYTYQVVTVHLVCADDQWYVQPGEGLLEAISGGTVG